MKRTPTSSNEIDPGELSGIFSAPDWMRDLGFSAWLLVGVGAALVGAIFLLAQTETIVMPVITAAIIASVTVPLVDWLKRHGVPRGAGAVLVFLGDRPDRDRRGSHRPQRDREPGRQSQREAPGRRK